VSPGLSGAHLVRSGGVWGAVTAYRSGARRSDKPPGGDSGAGYGSQTRGVPSDRTYWRMRFPVRVRFTFRCRGRRGRVPPGHGRSPCGSAVCAGGKHAWCGSAVMPSTVVAVGVVVVPGGWSAGCRVCSGGLPVGGAFGRPVGVETGGVLLPGEWLPSGTRGSGSDGGGSGGVGSCCRRRTVRSIGVPCPRDSPVDRGRACLSDSSIQQMVAAGRVCGRRGFSPLAAGPVCGFRTSLGFRVLLFPSWRVRGVFLSRYCCWWAARRAAWASSAWPACRRRSCCLALGKSAGAGGARGSGILEMVAQSVGGSVIR
jgi:hypothetical protein